MLSAFRNGIDEYRAFSSDRTGSSGILFDVFALALSQVMPKFWTLLLLLQVSFAYVVALPRSASEGGDSVVKSGLVVGWLGSTSPTAASGVNGDGSLYRICLQGVSACKHGQTNREPLHRNASTSNNALIPIQPTVGARSRSASDIAADLSPAALEASLGGPLPRGRLFGEANKLRVLHPCRTRTVRRVNSNQEVARPEVERSGSMPKPQIYPNFLETNPVRVWWSQVEMAWS